MRFLFVFICLFVFGFHNAFANSIILSKKFILVNNVPVISILINNQRDYFYVDTGSYYSVLQKDFIKNKNFIKKDQVKMSGTNGKISSYLVNEPSLALSKNLVLNNRKFFITNLGMSSFNNNKIIGTIGINILRDFNVEIDYKKNIIYFYKNKFKRKFKKDQIYSYYRDNVAYTPLIIDGVHADGFIDTGSMVISMIKSNFFKNYAQSSLFIGPVYVLGIGNIKQTAFEYKVESISVGDNIEINQSVLVTKSPRILGDQIVIGYNFLKGKRIFINRDFFLLHKN